MAEQDKIRDHVYDGIQEYDNPMPGWWTWIFILTVVFGVVYMLGIHVFDFVDTYEDDLAESQAELEAIRAAYEEANPVATFDEEAIAVYVGDPVQIEAGAAHFATYCAVCHGPEGQGLIGPNLTDNYWLHGNMNEDIFEVLTVGVVDKGMAAWAAVLSPEDRAQVVAFIRSIEGSNPPNAKEPQGELYE
jgi:cytochrome c oxidase cbb3-type subunit 3